MCGIAGLILAPPGPIRGEWVCSLLQHLEHRGPDDWGVLSLQGGNISLGREAGEDLCADLLLVHRRLSILDLSEAGWQPMGTSDRRY
jgi:asparagine synthase (glutamine-hydrolysing)